jgi:hypothetical protein
MNRSNGISSLEPSNDAILEPLLYQIGWTQLGVVTLEKFTVSSCLGVENQCR